MADTLRAIANDLHLNWLAVAMVSILLLLALLALQDGWRSTREKLRAILRERGGWMVPVRVFSIGLILTMTLLSRSVVKDPLKYLTTHWRFTGKAAHDKQIMENVLLFLPFGACLLPAGTAGGGRRVRMVIVPALISLGFSFCIESLQLIFRVGYFQFSDMLYNMLGGMLGGLFRLAAAELWHGRERR